MITPTILFWLLAALVLGVVAAVEGGALRRHPKVLISSVVMLLFALIAEYTAAPYVVDPTQWSTTSDLPGTSTTRRATAIVKIADLTLPKPCGQCPDLVLVRAGSLSPSDGDAATPTVIKISKPFGISRSEVTVADFASFVAKTGYRTKAGCVIGGTFDSTASWRSPRIPMRPEDPVTCVSYLDAKAYTAWLTEISGSTYRLPSDREWEHAVRQGQIRVVGPQYAQPEPPARTDSANAYRHVAELTSDCWTTDVRNMSTDERPVRLFGDCSFRPARGGSWASPIGAAALSARVMVGESTGTNWLGFRVVAELKPAESSSASAAGGSNQSPSPAFR